ncbi:uncharacterized protein PpBr36_09852 [Pyricularia pennisetigena]|uniref:uncharacterized protein n=1 Tax=Pyricularia pennisetigena TaxID=1578925 RepID=UPI001154CF64|nr:uncharacterized protein PpBr36_09852 [Pyricularia pennisetigena]TLS22191.1 hypothetical protein PpBr36_09852 [Pyricularia pennisetigena]
MRQLHLKHLTNSTVLTMAGNILHKWFPTTKLPLVISAPMFTVANGALAAAVTQAGGLGMVPAGMDPSANSPHLAALDEQLSIASRLLNHHPPDTATPLPIGVGFLTLLATPDAYRANALPILRRHRPAFVWLFGSDPAEPAYGEFVALFRDAGAEWGMRVFAQVGSVAAARQVVRCGVDVVVAQGCDAGGHQWAEAASVMTLVPEVVDALRGQAVAVVAGGGIMDGRGVAAALALGADGVTMGTRFVTCDEADSNAFVRKAILNASDGGSTTARSSMNDAIMGYPTWSKLYAGRVIRHPGLQDLANGVPLHEVHESFKKAVAEGDETRMVTFAGTGVGLVHKSQSAGEIVKEVRSEALAVIDKLQGSS